MFAERHRRVILEFVGIAETEEIAFAVSAIDECAGNGNGGAEVLGGLAFAIAGELEMGFVDHRRVDDVSIGSLHDLLTGAGIESLRGQGEGRGGAEIVGVVRDYVAVPQRYGVVFCGLPIEPRADAGARFGIGDGGGEGRGIEIGIEDYGVDDGGVADIAALGVEEERGFFGDGAAYVAAEKKCVIRRDGGDEGILCVEGLVVGVE